MQRLPTIFATLLLVLASAGGCAQNPPETRDGKETAENPPEWLEQGLAVEGMTISLGHRGPKPQAGDWLEPIVSITKDGNPLPDAMVFQRLISADGQTTIGDEAATVFEPASSGKPACYAQGKLRLPQDGGAVGIRFRVILPGVDKEWIKDAVLPMAGSAVSE